MATARWTTMDPADEFHSPYVYVGGDPVNLIDPDGRQSVESLKGAYDAAEAEVSGIVDFAVGLFTGETYGDLYDAGAGVVDLATFAYNDPGAAKGLALETGQRFINDFTAADERGKARMVSAAALTVFSPGKIAKGGKIARFAANVRVISYGEEVGEGIVDISRTLERIAKGRSFPHRNDGAVFRNREGRLPEAAQGYYREFVHPTPGLEGPGPQRLVVGQGGEVYYTPDHYESFVRMDYDHE